MDISEKGTFCSGYDNMKIWDETSKDVLDLVCKAIQGCKSGEYSVDNVCEFLICGPLPLGVANYLIHQLSAEVDED